MSHDTRIETMDIIALYNYAAGLATTEAGYNSEATTEDKDNFIFNLMVRDTLFNRSPIVEKIKKSLEGLELDNDSIIDAVALDLKNKFNDYQKNLDKPTETITLTATPPASQTESRTDTHHQQHHKQTQ